MYALTDAGRSIISDLSARHGVSESAVEAMARAVAQGGGTMAQFDIPELGGGGQWMAGGMTMVGDMFNSGLQARVTNLCGDLSAALAAHPMFVTTPNEGAGTAHWWPEDLGRPGSVGGQNQVRYAYFPDARRLALDLGDGSPVRVLDTGAHLIGGFSQQQSGYGGDPLAGLTFSSQLGQFAVSSLPDAATHLSAQSAPYAGPDGDAWAKSEDGEAEAAAAPASAPQDPAQHAPQDTPELAATPAEPAGALDPIDAIKRLGELRAAGVLTDEEFAAKKAELLQRI